MATTLVYWSYAVTVAAVAIFGIFAISLGLWRQRRKADDTEFFLTARHSVGALTIGWSFYAAAMGSWALFSPPSYSWYAGILGLAMYAFAAGLPIIIVAFFGNSIHKAVPDVMSLSDFVYRRFGVVFQFYVSTLMLLNMGINLTAEYTAIGDLFEYVIGTTRIPIVIIEGVVAAVYTAVGGLYVSIITDQVQAGTSVVLLVILVAYVAATLKAPLPRPLPAGLGPDNRFGLASIATMPISLMCATVFSEAMWQRCWASATPRTLKLGALLGACATTCAVFLFGFGGFLAVWSGVFQPAGPEDTGNTILFSLLGSRVWINVLVATLAVTLSLSAVDSLQNAIVDNIGGVFLRGFPVVWIRGLVLLLNVPPIVASLQGYSIIQLFLLANLITTTSAIPLLLGLAKGKVAERMVTGFSALCGCFLGLAALFVYARVDMTDGENYNAALHRVFIVEYDYPPFLLALGFSIVGVLLGAALEALVDAAIGAVRPGFRLNTILGAKPFAVGHSARAASAHKGEAEFAEYGKPAVPGKLEQL